MGVDRASTEDGETSVPTLKGTDIFKEQPHVLKRNEKIGNADDMSSVIVAYFQDLVVEGWVYVFVSALKYLCMVKSFCWDFYVYQCILEAF